MVVFSKYAFAATTLGFAPLSYISCVSTRSLHDGNNGDNAIYGENGNGNGNNCGFYWVFFFFGGGQVTAIMAILKML